MDPYGAGIFKQRKHEKEIRMTSESMQKVSTFLEKFNELPESANILVNTYAEGMAAGYQIGRKEKEDGKVWGHAQVDEGTEENVYIHQGTT